MLSRVNRIVRKMAELTPEIIREMEKLYAELGSYKKVSRRLNLDKKSVKAHFEGGWKPSSKNIKDEITSQKNVKSIAENRVEGAVISDGKTKAAAYRLYSDSKNPLTVATELGISADEAIRCQEDYWKLTGVYYLYHIQRVLPDIWDYLEAYTKMKNLHITPDQLKKELDGRNELIEAMQKLQQTRGQISEFEADLEKLKIDLVSKHDLIKKQERHIELKIDEYVNLADDVMKLESKKLTLIKFLHDFENSKSRYEMHQLVDKEVSKLLSNKYTKLSENMKSSSSLRTEEVESG